MMGAEAPALGVAMVPVQPQPGSSTGRYCKVQQLILFGGLVRVGVVGASARSGSSTVVSGRARHGRCGQVAAGGPLACALSSRQGCSQGRSVGRCRTSRRADRASRAGMVIRWAWMVTVVAFAWQVGARQPGAAQVDRDRGTDQPGTIRGERSVWVGGPADRTSGRRRLVRFDDGVTAVAVLGLDHRQGAVRSATQTAPKGRETSQETCHAG
jgi:hypothetical protein